MEEVQLRIEALARLMHGESSGSVCKQLNRSRRWLSKWRNRYDPTSQDWAASLSRAPQRIANRTDLTAEQAVCEVRRRLSGTQYSQRGALAIQWQLEQLGFKPAPAVWTINRILKRNGLILKRTYTPRGTPYPAPAVTQPGDLQQLDVVGPRYLAGGGRFYGIHCIDAYSNAVALSVATAQNAAVIAQALVAAWQRLGIPRMLQVDNGLVFRGSNRYPRSFGLVLRLALHLGVEVVFIPEGEPWRNGVIERFNNVYDKLFLRPKRFRDFVDLGEELPRFEQFHNSHHRYSKLGGQTPLDAHKSAPCRLLPADFSLTTLTWRDGRVAFIRLTDRNGAVRFFSERFTIDPTLIHEYVKGTVYTRRNRLVFTHQGRIVRTFPYLVNKHTRSARCPATSLC